MQCPKCGKELFDDAKYCPFCGTKLEIVEEVKKNGVTFKEGIVSLFTKFFLFQGKTCQSEFNYGFLFLLIISSVFSIFTLPVETLTISSGIGMNGMMDMMVDYMAEISESKNILDAYNLQNILSALVFAIFLSAPVYRRLKDCGYTNFISVLLMVLFVVSEIVCSNLLWCILPANIYELILVFIEILSFVNLYILLTCMLKKTKII